MVTDHGFPAYPVDVNLEKDILFFHEDGLDYGAYLLDPMASRALEKSGIVPVRKEQWDAEDLEEFSFWTLVGLPTQFANLNHEGPSLKGHVTVRVMHPPERPAGLSPTKHPRLFAKVDFASVAEWERQFDIGGMSGGPVFGTRQPPQGSAYDYRLIGTSGGVHPIAYAFLANSRAIGRKKTLCGPSRSALPPTREGDAGHPWGSYFLASSMDWRIDA
ncbi:hypothetical protein [Hydrogenophaga pseudoflava]|jgi:hypothetical protein|uniref:Uncharacterized protein n=1 Tax=Hydrogenophaga pseudoflava TaxID=47421 RepID=A0A4P6X152_HYDPS|nr:hypothetical protein [Hydrogenophaga pseudoflava]MCM2337089.1 hypothetical protein [Lysobacter sp.]QBM28475.1 hypothetical protein HPF_12315 [Hydrogenophaga pseudoflava]